MSGSDKSARIANRISAPPYSGIAGIYDSVLGNAMAPYIRKSFDHCVSAYHIRFKSIADIGCGTGTFLAHLPRKYHHVAKIGVDKSPAMLRIAKRRNAGNNARFICQDITRLRLPKNVDLITCNGDTLNYLLTPTRLNDTFNACYRNLNDGGHFVFDLIAGGKRQGNAGTTVQDMTLGNIRSIWTVSTDFSKGLSVANIVTFLPKNDGSIITNVRELHAQRWYGIPLINRLLNQAGFTIRSIFEVDSLKRVTPASFWVKYVATRKL